MLNTKQPSQRAKSNRPRRAMESEHPEPHMGPVSRLVLAAMQFDPASIDRLADALEKQTQSVQVKR